VQASQLSGGPCPGQTGSLCRGRNSVVGFRARHAHLLDIARRLLAGWDEGMAVVADAAAEQARTLRVGTLTSIGRALYPGVVSHFAKREPGWHIELHSLSWADPTGGLRDQASDAAFLWLPLDTDDIAVRTLVTERRFVALSTRHRDKAPRGRFGARPRQIDLRAANLARADLTRANLTGARLARANLARADLTGADLVPWVPQMKLTLTDLERPRSLSGWSRSARLRAWR
jgi:DNA-binding transcriptional LysR family regulator